MSFFLAEVNTTASMTFESVEDLIQRWKDKRKRETELIKQLTL